MDNYNINEIDMMYTEVTDDEAAADADENNNQEHVMCEVCSVVLENKSKLIRHKKQCHDEQTCPDCEHVVYGKKKLREHRRIHVMATCNICNQEVSKMKLRYHKKVCRRPAKEKKKHSCESCDFVASTRNRLEAHIKRIHTAKEQKSHSCGYCDYSHKTPAIVRRHEETCKSKMRLQPPANGVVTNNELVDLFCDMHTSMRDFNQMLQFFIDKFGKV